MRRSIALLVALAASLLVTGCGQAVGSAAAPAPCNEVFNAVRYRTMTDYVATQLGTTREEVANLDVIPQPTPETVNGVTIIHTRLGGPPVDVEVTLRNGSVHRVTLFCGRIPGVECQDDPHLEAGSVMHGGCLDIPCAGEPPQSCASPVPSVAPDALADAMPLRIARLDIPVDHAGP